MLAYQHPAQLGELVGTVLEHEQGRLPVVDGEGDDRLRGVVGVFEPQRGAVKELLAEAAGELEREPRGARTSIRQATVRAAAIGLPAASRERRPELRGSGR